MFRRSVLLSSPLLLVLLFITTIATKAEAQQNRTAQVARAEQMFNEAKKFLEQNDVSRACASFAESQKLDPQLGTLLNLALCHEREGKNASAWSEFTTVVSLATHAGQAKRAELAKEHARLLEPKLARVRFDTSQLPSDAKIAIDGAAPVEKSALEDVAVPIDPGAHSILVTAEGKKKDESKLEVGAAGTTATHRFHALAIDDTPPPPPRKPIPTKEEPTTPLASEGGLGTYQWLGIGVGAVGVVGVGVGTFFGLRAAALKDDANCGDTCTPQGDRTLADARDAGAVSTIAFIAGGALIVGGVLLYVLGPTKRSSQPRTTAVLEF